MIYIANDKRYDSMIYRRSGASGLKLSAVSLGLWHNFGDASSYENGIEMLKTAFDLGITHFDAANNYGPPPGAAEIFMGRALKNELKPYRDELIISTKAGYHMWEGPYGDGGSRKYLLSSLDQSLKRMGLDYVDIFYHHRPDDETPIEESMRALNQAIVSGKALYAGISNYRPKEARIAIDILKDLGTPCVIHQPRYSMMDRWVEDGLLDLLEAQGVGTITFSPLAKGILTDKYLNGIPANSRAAGASPFLSASDITEDVVAKVRRLSDMATARSQTMAEMALAWVLRQKAVTSVLIGASRPAQIIDAAGTLKKLDFSAEELETIDGILGK